LLKKPQQKNSFQLELLRTYLKKHAAGDSLVQAEPEKGLKYIVVIPSYLETSLNESLVSLFNATSPLLPFEIIIVVNWPEDESQENMRISLEEMTRNQTWTENNSKGKNRVHFIEAGYIPRKKAGVGYARKTGMDEAVRRFLRTGQEDGIIISFDADTKCSYNYFTSIEEHFRQHPKTDGCTIYFEHPLEGTEYSDHVYKAITQYELHMRYYLQAVRYTGHPNAFYTVGSAFAVRSNSYCRQGGMNIRQAGEDFYFLQKFFDLGNFTDLVKTTVFPSPRPSSRVPFGTGKAIVKLLESGFPLQSYNPAIFDILKEFFAEVPQFYQQISSSGEADLLQFHPCLLDFLNDNGFHDELMNIFKNSGSISAFTKRFYRYFNMFRILKFAKHSQKKIPDQTVSVCAETIMQKTGMNVYPYISEKDMLEAFRSKDRETSNDLQ
jgi:hypothetical protein